MARQLVLRMADDRVFYNLRQGIALEQTNLPAGHFRFRQHEPIYWLVEMVEFRAGRLSVRVLTNDLDEAELAAFAEQRPKTTVTELWFEPFDLAQLSVDFSYYDRAALSPLIREADPEAEALLPRTSDRLMVSGSLSEERPFFFTLERRLRRFRFESGAAVLVYQGRRSPVAQPLELRVVNSFFLPEFEYIKPYFARTLGIRKVTLRVSGRVRDGVVVELRVHCPVLGAIDERMIDVVRYRALRATLSRAADDPAAGPVDKSLFTAEEIGDVAPELGNVLHWSERALLGEFLADESVRNRTQLQYLAGKLQAPDRKVHFTLRPQFGFVFSVKGEAMDHYIWELLDSHATYIWSFDREEVVPKRQLRLLHEALTQVREQGREVYRRGGVAHAEYQLAVVRHFHANSDLVDGFPRWRASVAEKLV